MRSRQLTFKSSRGGSGNLGNLGNLKIRLHEVPLGWFGESGESDKSLHGESGESDKVVNSTSFFVSVSCLERSKRSKSFF